MTKREELEAERLELLEQLAILNQTIKNVLGRNNKKYLYSNQESTHQHELQDIKQLRQDRKNIKEEIATINRQLGYSVVFTQFKS